jgi:hypothetical protein
MRKNTNRIELVETHNLTICLRRLCNITPYDNQAWRRALIHAIGISNAYSSIEMFSKIREALELP